MRRALALVVGLIAFAAAAGEAPVLDDGLKRALAVVAGTDAIAEGFGGVSRIPTLFVFDRDGRIVYDFVNARGAARTSVSAAELRAVIEPLLGAAPPAG